MLAVDHPIKTVILKGWYGESNFGDDLLLNVLSRTFGNAGLEVLVWSRCAAYLRKIAPNVRCFNPWTQFRRPAALVYGGGTQFFTFPGSNYVWYTPSKFRGFLRNPKKMVRLPITALWMAREAVRRARLRGVSFRAALAVGVGPFMGSWEDTSATLRALRSLDWLSVRDRESKETCVTYGIESVKLTADLAFLHPAIGQHSNSRSTEVIMIPRFSPMDQDWVKWETAIIQSLQALSFGNVLIVSLCRRDADLARSLAQKISAHVQEWDPNRMQLEDMIYRLSSARLVITARYHGALVSAAAGVPTLVLGLEQKLVSISRQLPSASLIEHPEDVAWQITHALETKECLECERTATIVDEMRQSALLCIRDLLNAMGY